MLNYVTSIDRIDSKKRKGQPGIDAIYVVKPTKFNINCIDADFSNRPPKYKTAHIRFLPGFQGHLVSFFNSKQYIRQYMSSLKELKCGFIPKEHWYFQTMDIDQPLQIFFNSRCAELIEQNIAKTVSSLLNLCIITGEYPIVRYSEPTTEEYALSKATILSKKVAFQFQQALDDYARSNENFPPPNPRPRSVLIITDRSHDLFSPILHSFSYQALSYDLLDDIDKRSDIYKYEAENESGEMEEKSSKLCDLLDPLWLELKHQHIIDASEYLNTKINELIAKNPLLVDRSNVKTTTDLLSVVAHLKDFDEERRRITLHRTMIDKCLKISQERDLAHIADFEQILSGFGVNFDGEKCKHLADQLIETLANSNLNLTDKIRYIVEYALYRGGLIEQDFIKLLSFIQITQDHSYFTHFMEVFRNFQYLGFKLIRDQPNDKPFKKEWTHDTITNNPNIFQTSRFVPSVGNILSKVISNPLFLSEDTFPYVKDKPIELLDPQNTSSRSSVTSTSSLRNPRHKAAWAKNNTQNKAPRQRFFYYILGGITYAELNASYSQSCLKNKDIFIGSDCIFTPSQFIHSMEYLSNKRETLKLRDDERENENAPEFLFDRAVAQPATNQYIHTSSHQPNNRDLKPSLPAGPRQEPKEKKHKFTKFLRSK